MRVTSHSTRSLSPARRVAFATLSEVAGGAYASDSLREHSRNISPRDAGLASQIVFGCLRFQKQLDFLILFYSGHPADRLDEPVRLALRAAIFQLRYLSQIPAHAAVHESVEYVKFMRRPAVSLTNAVLRKVTRDPISWPDAATELSCPEWLLDHWSEHFGPEIARGIASAALCEPDAYIRLAPGAPLPSAFEGGDATLEPTEVAGAWRVRGNLPAGVRLHDISSQTVVPLLAINQTDNYLDLCAAPGNKTLQALESTPRLAVACDISLKRLREIPPVCPRVLLDATDTLPFPADFDKIFIDAPCSGTGTLARNPEIKWRLRPEDLPFFRQRQLAILSQAATVLAHDGRIVYATCSLEREEDEEVVGDFLRLFPDFQCTHDVWRIPGRDPGDGFYAAVLERA